MTRAVALAALLALPVAPDALAQTEPSVAEGVIATSVVDRQPQGAAEI